MRLLHEHKNEQMPFVDICGASFLLHMCIHLLSLGYNKTQNTRNRHGYMDDNNGLQAL